MLGWPWWPDHGWGCAMIVIIPDNDVIIPSVICVIHINGLLQDCGFSSALPLSWWLSARLWSLQCKRIGDTTVLHYAIDWWRLCNIGVEDLHMCDFCFKWPYGFVTHALGYNDWHMIIQYQHVGLYQTEITVHDPMEWTYNEVSKLNRMNWTDLWHQSQRNLDHSVTYHQHLL